MNMEYWIGVVNVLTPASFAITVVGVFTASLLLIEIYAPMTKTEPSKLKVPIIIATTVTILFFLLWIFVPSVDAIRAMYR